MTVAVCCTVLQCVAVCCSELKCVCSDSGRVSKWGLVYAKGCVFVRYCTTLHHVATHVEASARHMYMYAYMTNILQSH